MEVKGFPVPSTSEADLLLYSDKKVSGSTGCNRITGSFDIQDKGSIKFSPLCTTRMACPDENINKIEADFLEVLSETNSWKMENEMLYLMAGKDILAKPGSSKNLSVAETKLNGTWELNLCFSAQNYFCRFIP